MYMIILNPMRLKVFKSPKGLPSFAGHPKLSKQPVQASRNVGRRELNFLFMAYTGIVVNKMFKPVKT